MEEKVLKRNATLGIFGELKGNETLLQLGVQVAIGIYFDEYDELPKKLVDIIIENIDPTISFNTTIDNLVYIISKAFEEAMDDAIEDTLKENSPSKAIENVGYALERRFPACIAFDKCYNDEGEIYYEYTNTFEKDDDELPTIYHNTIDDAREFLKDHFKEYACSVEVEDEEE